MSAGEILSSAFVFWALTALAAIMPLTLFRYETTGKDTIEYFLYYIAYVTVGTIGILASMHLANANDQNINARRDRPVTDRMCYGAC